MTGALRAAIYARFSSDLQRDASIEDQIRSCREYAARQGLKVVEAYSDRAVSGASLMRSGMQKLLRDAGSHANARGQLAVAFDAQAGGNTGLAIGEEVAGTLHGGGSPGR